MQTVTSTDGAEIAYREVGDGPPLVLVHGGGLGESLWTHLRPQLVTDTTVVAPYRRGHGQSGDAAAYSLDRESDDISAVVEKIDGPPTVFGHSFGGLCALEAARTTPVERLILYEPALLVGNHRNDATLAAEMESLIETGERRQAMALYLRKATGLEHIDHLLTPEMLDHAEIAVRQNRAIERYRLDETLDLSVPTLLLVSEDGPEHLRDGVRTLHERLPNSQLVELEGMGHQGIVSEPERVAATITAFVGR
ncbi:alpha/beta fold hydrolase [Halocatena pleomorpha]|uniref:Alpha/beta hydrolase n=1 Tax=Halocatena pleomorpha TaxID=1785090 RepID=A0A3P3R612_9EURY|nr:alpha/beta hydrolase [Halocatena pleomorpha]RRJ28912.1 alpha/beta hydrolase [Halocatena pleomorpha]